MGWLTLDQFGALGKQCSQCDRPAQWLAHKDSPAYCDEHFPYREEMGSLKDFFGEDPSKWGHLEEE